MHGLLYVTASPLTDQPCDHDMLLRQRKGSSDNCVNSLLTRCIMIMLTAVWMYVLTENVFPYIMANTVSLEYK